MKLTMNRITQGEDEVIIKYHEINEQIEAIAGLVQGESQKISAYADGQTFLLLPEDILYLESVDGATFAYLEKQVGKVLSVLFETEENGLWTGHSGNYCAVTVSGKDLRGLVKNVKISGILGENLVGDLV